MAKVVAVNSKVTLYINNIKKTFHLVKSEDLDSASAKISVLSPLGRLLINKKEKDEVEVQAPSGVVKYQILNIE